MASKREMILEAARAFAAGGLARGEIRVRELGLPSLDHDDRETHFVVVESPADSLLLKVTIDHEGRTHAEPLVA